MVYVSKRLCIQITGPARLDFAVHVDRPPALSWEGEMASFFFGPVTLSIIVPGKGRRGRGGTVTYLQAGLYLPSLTGAAPRSQTCMPVSVFVSDVQVWTTQPEPLGVSDVGMANSMTKVGEGEGEGEKEASP